MTRKQQIITQAEQRIQNAKNFKIQHLMLEVDGQARGVTCLTWENTGESSANPKGFISVEYLHYVGIE